MLYFILKENNLSVGVKVYKLVLYNLLSHRNSLPSHVVTNGPVNIIGTAVVSFHAVREASLFW